MMRFIKEYANYKKKKIRELKDAHINTTDAILEINNALIQYNLGLMTVDEVMRVISNIEVW